MRPIVFFGVTAYLLLGSLGQVAAGRIVETWEYERLFKESDLVVIATAVETEDGKEKLRETGWPLEFIAMNTKFDVNHVLKGKVGKTIKVLHYKFGEPMNKDEKSPIGIVDGPLFVKFRTKSHKLDGGKYTIPQPEYMLFLKKRDDGRFEPVSGIVDPQFSVKEVFKPLPNELGGSKAD